MSRCDNKQRRTNIAMFLSLVSSPISHFFPNNNVNNIYAIEFHLKPLKMCMIDWSMTLNSQLE